MTEDKIPRKWEYIADQLRQLNAPKKVINAAVEIDNAMVDLGLGYNTEAWKSRFIKYPSSTAHIAELSRLIGDEHSCTACYDADESCTKCKLGNLSKCTPRSKHADNYYGIVRRWANDRIRENKDEI